MSLETPWIQSLLACPSGSESACNARDQGLNKEQRREHSVLELEATGDLDGSGGLLEVRA